ncbi:MAG: hypothetical protein C0453_20530 [Comamonadaceae bacterium]|nr:hypothetical protein [Comamonadaceae bacterium]
MEPPTLSTPSTGSFDPTHCPLCGGDNRCAMEIERATGLQQPPCWCVSATFSPDLLARIPADAGGKACVCATCLARFEAERQTGAGEGR